MRTATRRLTVILLATAVLLGASLFLAFGLSRYAGEKQDDVLHTYDVLQATQALLALVQDAETGQRGYLLTHQDSYLAPYREAVNAIPGAVAKLSTLVADNAGQVARIATLDGLIKRKLDELETTIGLSRTDGFEAALAVVLTNSGKAVMDQIRATTDEILAERHAALTQRIADADAVENQTLIVAVLAGLIGLAALITAAVGLARSYRRVRATEIALSAQTMVLQATLDNCRDGVAVFDKDQALAASNGRFFQLFGIPPSARRERKLFAELVTGDGKRLDAIAAAPPGAAAPYGESSGTLFHVVHDNREIEIYRNTMPDGGLILACADITRRVRAEEMVRQTQKTEAIGQLTGGVAHDFNNLLQVIRTNLDLLAGDVKGNTRAEERLRNALVGTERGARLTQQLLAYARRQPLAPVVVNLGRLVNEMTDLLRRTLGETIEIETVVAGGLWNTLVDPGQVENAILNLAINARDAMPGGGKLTIELANSSLDETYAAEHSEVAPGQYVMLAVTDTGAGMTPEVIARAFEPFYTTKGEGKGTGLGLSMVFGFVKQSEGHAKIYSEPGHGTTVKLYLPRSRRPEDIVATVPLGPAAGGDECILVVEDEPAVRRAAVDMLKELGYRVLEAENGEKAMAVLTSGAGVDLLFTDVVMPGPMTSRDLARQAQARFPGMAVLFTSGYTENAIIHHGRLDEDVHLISKPYGKDELAHKIRATLAEAKRAAAAPAAAEAKATQAGERALTVLLVEDEPLIRLATVDQLEELGHRVIDTGTAQEALRVIDGRDDLDVLLTDVGLPGMNGRELALEARRRLPALRIVIATGRSSPAHGGLAAIADAAHLNKPYHVEQLRRALAATESRA
ncbi:MAG: CHASE3 domain-containing protein [Candidatus Eiseniibacteriota bacterium]